MNNTQLLRDLIATAQAAGNAIRSQRFDDAHDYIDDVLLIAERLAQPQVTHLANRARKVFAHGFLSSADGILRNLIITSDRLLGRI